MSDFIGAYSNLITKYMYFDISFSSIPYPGGAK